MIWMWLVSYWLSPRLRYCWKAVPWKKSCRLKAWRRTGGDQGSIFLDNGEQPDWGRMTLRFENHSSNTNEFRPIEKRTICSLQCLLQSSQENLFTLITSVSLRFQIYQLWKFVNNVFKYKLEDISYIYWLTNSTITVHFY